MLNGIVVYVWWCRRVCVGVNLYLHVCACACVFVVGDDLMVCE